MMFAPASGVERMVRIALTRRASASRSTVSQYFQAGAPSGEHFLVPPPGICVRAC